jgi:hypothetical protein
MNLQVVQVRPAPAALASWLQRLLLPVCEIARLQPFACELRPTGLWAGWSAGSDSAPDFRVCLSNRVVLYTSAFLVQVYLHESVHALLHQVDPLREHGHDAAFFAINLALLTRLDAAQDNRLPRTGALWTSSMTFYDLQDAPVPLAEQQPGAWWPVAAGWSMRVAEELATMDLDAAALAREICTRYGAWCSQLEAESAANHEAQRRAASLRAHREQEQAKADARLAVRLAAAAFIGIGAAVATLGNFIVSRVH